MVSLVHIERKVIKFLIGWVIGFVLSIFCLPTQLAFTKFSYFIILFCLGFALSFEWIANVTFGWLIQQTKLRRLRSGTFFLKWLWEISESNFWSENVKEKFWKYWKQSAEYLIQNTTNHSVHWRLVLDIERQARETPPIPIIEPAVSDEVIIEQLEIPLNIETSTESFQEQAKPFIPSQIQLETTTSETVEDPLRSEKVRQEIYNRALISYRMKMAQMKEEQPKQITKEETKKIPIEEILPPLPIVEKTSSTNLQLTKDDENELEKSSTISVEDSVPSTNVQDIVELPSITSDQMQQLQPTENLELSSEVQVKDESVHYHPEIPHLPEHTFIETRKKIQFYKITEKIIGVLIIAFLKFFKSLFNLREFINFIVNLFRELPKRTISVFYYGSTFFKNLIQFGSAFINTFQQSIIGLKKKKVTIRLPILYYLSLIIDWLRENLGLITISSIVVILIGIIVLTTISVIELGKQKEIKPLVVETIPEATKNVPKGIPGQRIVVDIGEQESLSSAMKKVERLKQAGFADARIYLTFDRKVYIHVGNCQTKQEAKELGWKLMNQNFTKSFTFLTSSGREIE
ncbi:MAG: hypothetical protein N2450_00255 [bacterium]|nr:hypothetical protein [bacterium]